MKASAPLLHVLVARHRATIRIGRRTRYTLGAIREGAIRNLTALACARWQKAINDARRTETFGMGKPSSLLNCARITRVEGSNPSVSATFDTAGSTQL